VDRRINYEEIHARAVETGRQSGVPDAGERLAAINPDKFVEELVARIKPEKAQSLTDAEITNILADHLWIGWLQVELSQAEKSANHTD